MIPLSRKVAELSTGPPLALWPAPTTANYAVGVLLLAVLFSTVDRAILGLLVIPIKKDLGVSDAAMGALLGAVFAVASAIMGLIAGWLADRFSRRNLIAIAIFSWSIATAACGLATTFRELLLGRVAVASGESALSPASFSMITDYFPPRRLGWALGVYMTGTFLGVGLAFLLGGSVLGFVATTGVVELPVLGTMKIWQVVFLVVGLPGVLVALLMLTVQEPARQGVREVRPPTAAVFRFVWEHSSVYSLHVLGFSLLACVIVIPISWGPTMFARVHGFSQAGAGLTLGVILLILAPAGILSGGRLVGVLQASGRTDAPFLVGILAAVASLPFALAGNLVADERLAVALYCPLVFLASLAVACGATAIQLVTPNEFRAQLSASYVMTVNIVTAIFGATAVGFSTDYVFHNELAVGKSMALVSGICAPAAAIMLWRGCRPFRQMALSTSARPVVDLR